MSRENATNAGEVRNVTTMPPATTTEIPPTTEVPGEEKPESPEVEQQGSMTIFFILLVVGMLLSVSRLLSNVKLCYLQLTYSWIDLNLSLFILTHSHLSRP